MSWLGPFILDFLLRLDNILYRLISVSAISVYKIHPKHAYCDYTSFFISNINSDSIVLDLGCHEGKLLLPAARLAKKVYGIELDFKRFSRCRQNIVAYKLTNTHVFNENIIDFDYSLICYNTVFMSNIYEHLEYEDRCLLISTILSEEQNVNILIRVPQFDRSWVNYLKQSRHIYYFTDPDHKAEFTLETLDLELKKYGLKSISSFTKSGEIFAIYSN